MHTHELRLRDVRDGRLVVSYLSKAENRTAQMMRDVSVHLPVECLALFDGGTVAVSDLTSEERAWVRSESARWGNEIDFEGVRT